MDTDALVTTLRTHLPVTVVAVILLAGIGGAVAGETMFTSTETFTYQASGTIAAPTNNTSRTRVGVAAGPNMNFGAVPGNANITKFVRISTAKKARVTVSADGNISGFLDSNAPQYFQGEREVRVTFRPGQTQAGNYSGTVTVTVQLPDNAWGQRWLDIKHRLS